jgi:hypothetical protein
MSINPNEAVKDLDILLRRLCFLIASGSVPRSHFYPERERISRFKAGVPVVKKI